jgi:hypothetical protein
LRGFGFELRLQFCRLVIICRKRLKHLFCGGELWWLLCRAGLHRLIQWRQLIGDGLTGHLGDITNAVPHWFRLKPRKLHDEQRIALEGCLLIRRCFPLARGQVQNEQQSQSTREGKREQRGAELQQGWGGGTSRFWRSHPWRCLERRGGSGR